MNSKKILEEEILRNELAAQTGKKKKITVEIVATSCNACNADTHAKDSLLRQNKLFDKFGVVIPGSPVYDTISSQHPRAGRRKITGRTTGARGCCFQTSVYQVI